MEILSELHSFEGENFMQKVRRMEEPLLRENMRKIEIKTFRI